MLKGFNVLIIGASTGGPSAIRNVVSRMENLENTAVLITQHMPATFTERFARRLNDSCRYNVVEAQDGDKIQPGKIFVAKGGYHMQVEKGIIRLNEDDPIHGVRPAVDKLFISVANEFKDRVIAIILTGMGKDGAIGIETVKKNGGVTIAQDEESCAIFGMPRAAIKTGAVDYILPISEIPQKVMKLINER